MNTIRELLRKQQVDRTFIHCYTVNFFQFLNDFLKYSCYFDIFLLQLCFSNIIRMCRCNSDLCTVRLLVIPCKDASNSTWIIFVILNTYGSFYTPYSFTFMNHNIDSFGYCIFCGQGLVFSITEASIYRWWKVETFVKYRIKLEQPGATFQISKNCQL